MKRLIALILLLSAPLVAQVTTWTNKDGKKIQAEQVGLDLIKQTAQLKTADGKVYDVPFASLNDADAAKAQSWMAALTSKPVSGGISGDQILDEVKDALKKLPLPAVTKLDNPVVWEDANVSGQCFIVTKGGDNVKLGLITIAIYDPKTTNAFYSYALDWEIVVAKGQNSLLSSSDPNARELSDSLDDVKYDGYKNLPEPLYSVKTDADGKFILKKLPKDDFRLFAIGSRKVGSNTEHYVWVIEAKDVRGKDQLFLSSDNHK